MNDNTKKQVLNLDDNIMRAICQNLMQAGHEQQEAMTLALEAAGYDPYCWLNPNDPRCRK